MELSVENSDVQVEDLANDTFARSDIEDAAEPLIDFEIVSPYTKALERNPTFKEWGQRSSLNFQKTITMRASQEVKKESDSSLESSIDFEKDSNASKVLQEEAPCQDEKDSLNVTPVLILEDSSSFCSCKRTNCGLIKNSCVIT
jgi:hypothetical protein